LAKALVRVKVRIRLAGPLQIEAGTRRLDAADFPGRQGRLVFAALALARGPVDRNALADILWPNRLPASWTRDLSAVISKLRVLSTDFAELTTGNGRWYALQLPADARIDVEAATAAIEGAERDRAAGDAARALHDVEPQVSVLTEPFLAGDDCAWVDERRSAFRDVLVRALVLRAEVLCGLGAPAAVSAAQELVDAEPEREQAYVLLMRAYVARGDRVEALRTYEQLRKMLADEFGLSPSDDADDMMRTALGPEDAPPRCRQRRSRCRCRHRSSTRAAPPSWAATPRCSGSHRCTP